MDSNAFAPYQLFTCPGLGLGLKKIENNPFCPVPTFHQDRASSLSLCITVSVVEKIWTLWFVFIIFCVASLERFVLVRISRNMKILKEIWLK